MRRFALLALVISTAAQAACATIGRERCPGDAPGEAPSERDEFLVKRLLRTLFTDDFMAFQRLQPTESQYVTLAWRFGTSQADSLMGVIREPEPAAASFQAVRTRLIAAGIDVRTAARCTRKVDSHADEPRLYTLDLSFAHGDKLEHVRADVFDSGGRVSVVGSLGGPGLGAVMSEMFDLMEGFVTLLGQKTERAKHLADLRAYSAAHHERYTSLQREMQAALGQDPSAHMQDLVRFSDRAGKIAEQAQQYLTAEAMEDVELRDIVMGFLNAGGGDDDTVEPPDDPSVDPDAPPDAEPGPGQP